MDMGNIPSYGKSFRSETEISSARGLDGLSKLLNSVLISQSYKLLPQLKNFMLKVKYSLLTMPSAWPDGCIAPKNMWPQYVELGAWEVTPDVRRIFPLNPATTSVIFGITCIFFGLGHILLVYMSHSKCILWSGSCSNWALISGNNGRGSIQGFADIEPEPHASLMLG